MGEGDLILSGNAVGAGARGAGLSGGGVAWSWKRAFFLARLWLMDWLMQKAARDLVKAEGVGEEQGSPLIGEGERWWRLGLKAEGGLASMGWPIPGGRVADLSSEDWEEGCLMGDNPEAWMDGTEGSWPGSLDFSGAGGSLWLGSVALFDPFQLIGRLLLPMLVGRCRLGGLWLVNLGRQSEDCTPGGCIGVGLWSDDHGWGTISPSFSLESSRT